MVPKKEILALMNTLNVEINYFHPGTELAKYVKATAKELTKSDGVALTGLLQQFLNQAPVIKLSDKITFTPTEKKLWDKLFSYNKLENNLWAASY
ncbi:hypothetical protein [Lactobacillus gigeriorum]|uniref:Conserved protein n=1 Tax=Lactobacillus gigeriorum DSM 23908 = CRBIP 24.85 TaxID=1423751 RepID=I7LCT9_9LACO|nr:hypothetical protein [Lactobacillus gigeriorum]KRN14054.1 hypothetical protein FC38_GL001643 [Lactobacillus gigeriorum DSM 23908 = CRBIP 24.85]CCI86781.1 Conserved protein [Lactobacillus gigeriorum DSM 23908 = CRBIP 24.85]